MGILDIFKRHKDDDLGGLNLPDEAPQSYDFSSSGAPDNQPTMPGPANQNYGQPGPGQGFGAQMQSPQSFGQGDMVGKELEIISSKLDSIRAMLESLNQRVSGLERVAYGDQSYGPSRRY